VKVHCDEGVATHEHLTLAEVVEIFLVSGPPEERQVYAGDIHKNQDCRIVLCSIYHSEQVRTTLDYVVEGLRYVRSMADSRAKRRIRIPRRVVPSRHDRYLRISVVRCLPANARHTPSPLGSYSTRTALRPKWVTESNRS
jgi:hypothetical protein